VNQAAILRTTVAEQLTVERMPMKLRVATRPSGRTKPWNVARWASSIMATSWYSLAWA
jgi:hypothetical protein